MTMIDDSGPAESVPEKNDDVQLPGEDAPPAMLDTVPLEGAAGTPGHVPSPGDDDPLTALHAVLSEQESAFDNYGHLGLPGDDNPMAVFDAPPGGGGGGGAHAPPGGDDPLAVFEASARPEDDNPLAALDAAPVGGGERDALAGDDPLAAFADSKADVSAGEAEPFKSFEEDMKECSLYRNRSDSEDEEGPLPGPGANRLDTSGWNQRLTDPDGDDLDAQAYVPSSGEYGTDDKTPRMDVNLPRGQNNSRRGFFGQWRSGRRHGDNNPSASGGSDGGPPYNKVSGDEIEEAALAYGEGGITGDFNGPKDTTIDIVDEDAEEDEQIADNKLRPGDHIYIWQTYGINPRAYQRHAVVLSVTRVGEADPATLPPPQSPAEERARIVDADGELAFDLDTLHKEDEDRTLEVTVVSFYHLQTHGGARAPGAGRGERAGCRRDFLVDFIGPDGLNRKKPIHKVKYGRKIKKGLLSQKAAGTALKKDRVGLIMARARYLLDHPESLPLHHALSANGECASLWTVTGRWCTLHGASILAVTSAGQAGGALLAGGILSNLTLLVPMPGVWGMAGWWWYVPATVAYPFLVPMLVTLGMASLVPLEILRRNRKKWRKITDHLNHEFWADASEDIKAEYFGVMAAADREAEMRGFFGVREDASSAEDDAKYMPVGTAPGGMEDDEDEDEARAMQQMEKSCQKMAGDMKVDPWGSSTSDSGSPRGTWGKIMGSFRNSRSGRSEDDDLLETQRFRTTSGYRD